MLERPKMAKMRVLKIFNWKPGHFQFVTSNTSMVIMWASVTLPTTQLSLGVAVYGGKIITVEGVTCGMVDP